MNDVEIQQRFVFLRAEGWSFARIAADLKVSKPTLINWSRKFQFDIQNQRAINIEALKEKWLASRDVRVNQLGEQLRKAEAELAKRDLATVFHWPPVWSCPVSASADSTRNRADEIHHSRFRNPEQ